MDRWSRFLKKLKMEPSLENLELGQNQFLVVFPTVHLHYPRVDFKCNRRLRENLLKTRMGSQGFCQNAHGNTSD